MQTTAGCGRRKSRFQHLVVEAAYFNAYYLARAGSPGPALRSGINFIQTERPARGPAAHRGVRPTIFADRPVMGKTSGIGLTIGRRISSCPTSSAEFLGIRRSES